MYLIFIVVQSCNFCYFFILFRLFFFLSEGHKFIGFITVKCYPLEVKSYLLTYLRTYTMLIQYCYFTDTILILGFQLPRCFSLEREKNTLRLS